MTATGSRPTATETKDRLDGADLVAMFTAAAAALQSNIGTHQRPQRIPRARWRYRPRTCISPCRAALTILGGLTAPTASRSGFSGVRLLLRHVHGSQGKQRRHPLAVLQGVLRGTRWQDRMRGVTTSLAPAISRENNSLQSRLRIPVEGTMLTVIASVADATRDAAGDGLDIATLLSIASDRARGRPSPRLPGCSPSCREAGVVDAGGQGLAVIIEGMRRSAAGRRRDRGRLRHPGPGRCAVGVGPRVRQVL